MGSFDDEQKVPCPYCGAAAGQRCTLADGRPVNQFPHGLRRQLAVMEGHLPSEYMPREAREQIARWKASGRPARA